MALEFPLAPRLPFAMNHSVLGGTQSLVPAYPRSVEYPRVPKKQIPASGISVHGLLL